MSKQCETCSHKKHPDGGYCYMFREEVPGDFCAQHTLVQKAVNRSMLIGGTVAALVSGGLDFSSALDSTLKAYDL